MARSFLVWLGAMLVAAAADAQTVGTFRWQLQPYCNIVTVNVTQQAGTYTVDGFDDQCGAPQRASVAGTAFINPDGTVGIGMTTVLAPGGGFVHVDARISLATLTGPWSDSAGNSGTFTFTPGAGTGGPVRPVAANGIAPGSITATQIDPTQVQRRVSAICPSGQYLRGIQVDGAVICQPLTTSTSAGSVPLNSYSYYMDTTTSRDYNVGQVFLRTTGVAGSFQLCRGPGGVDPFPFVRYVNGARSTGSLFANQCVSATVGAGGDFQIYIRRVAIFGVHAGDSGGFAQNYNIIAFSQL